MPSAKKNGNGKAKTAGSGKAAPEVPRRRGRPASVAVEPEDVYATQVVDIGSLKNHPRNYKEHPDEQLDHIGHLMKTVGVFKNVVVSADGFILAGHGVVAAAKRVGRTKIPVKVLPLKHDSPLAMKVVAADNEVGHLAENDDRLLSEILRELREDPAVGLMGTGFDDAKLAAHLMVTRPASEIRSINEANEWLGLPEYDEGADQVKLVVTFKNEKDREKFVKKADLKIDKVAGSTWSTRWPFTRREDAASIRFETGKAAAGGAG